MDKEQIIRRVEPGLFDVWWRYIDTKETVRKSYIRMNWNRLYNGFKKKIESYTNPIMLHWQAKPKGLRRWGIYLPREDMYLGTDYILSESKVPLETIQHKDDSIREVPTASLLIDTKIRFSEKETLLYND